MKMISIAFLAAMSLAAAGCRKNEGAEAIARLTLFRDEMCACKDKACSDKVSGEYSRWSRAQAKSDGDKSGTPSEQDKKMEELTEELTRCLLKLEVPSGGSAAGAAGAAGSAEGAGGAGAAGSAGGTTGSGNPAAGSTNGAAGSAAAGSAH